MIFMPLFRTEDWERQHAVGAPLFMFQESVSLLQAVAAFYWSGLSSVPLGDPVNMRVNGVIFPPVTCAISWAFSRRAPLRVSTRLSSFDMNFSFRFSGFFS
jgi:hypothetical protein